MQQMFWALHWLSCLDSLAHEKVWGDLDAFLSFKKSLRQKGGGEERVLLTY
jgi:hypothetical protein